MEDYKKMYFELFNEITDVIEKLKEIQIKNDLQGYCIPPYPRFSAVKYADKSKQKIRFLTERCGGGGFASCPH